MKRLFAVAALVVAKKVERKPGTTHITGTATASGTSYAVDITR